MTAYQFATLKYLLNHPVTVEEAGKLSMVTFGSLAQRGWIKYNSGVLELTDEGMDEYYRYSKGPANFRKVDTGISDRVKGLLHLNRIRLLKKIS